MRTAEIEPFEQFAEPFVQTDAEIPSESETEVPSLAEDTTGSHGNMNVTECPCDDSDGNETVRRNAVLKVNVTTYTKAVLQHRAQKERRTMSVVLTEAVRQFLLKDTYEPRPYIPVNARPLMTGDRQKLTATVPVGMLEALAHRAEDESRDMSIIVTRAILDYIDTEVD